MAEKSRIPSHIAIIMDGNGRWVAARGLPRTAGHVAGVKALKKTVVAALEKGIKYLTVFAFSTENWERPVEEVNALMALLATSCRKELKNMLEDGIRVKFIGRRDNLSALVLKSIEKTENMTACCDKMQLNIAFNYSGKSDILQAVNRAIAAGKEIISQEFEDYLFTAGVPEPDVIVRTAGEKRISNFMLYQAAYSELIFTDKYWPDFNKKQLEKVLDEYAGRERRFGKLVTEDKC